MTQTTQTFLPGKLIAVAAVRDNPANYKLHSPEQLDRLKASLTRFGQPEPIVVQEQTDPAGNPAYLLVAHHAVTQAARELGWTELDAKIVPAEWTDEQVIGYLVASNLTTQGASDEETLLARLLGQQLEAGFTLDALGSYEEHYSDLMDRLAAAETLGGPDTNGNAPGWTGLMEFVPPQPNPGEGQGQGQGFGATPGMVETPDGGFNASQIRMAQLFFTTLTYQPFMDKCKALAERFATANLTDTIEKAVGYAFDNAGE